MQEQDNVVELVSVPMENLPPIHKFAIFLIGNVVCFGASWAVEKGYVKGLTSWRTYRNSKIS